MRGWVGAVGRRRRPRPEVFLVLQKLMMPTDDEVVGMTKVCIANCPLIREDSSHGPALHPSFIVWICEQKNHMKWDIFHWFSPSSHVGKNQMQIWYLRVCLYYKQREQMFPGFCQLCVINKWLVVINILLTLSEKIQRNCYYLEKIVFPVWFGSCFLFFSSSSGSDRYR